MLDGINNEPGIMGNYSNLSRFIHTNAIVDLSVPQSLIPTIATLPTIIAQTRSTLNGIENETGTMGSYTNLPTLVHTDTSIDLSAPQSLIPSIATLPATIVYHGQEDSISIDSAIPNIDNQPHMTLTMTTLDDNKCNVSQAHIFDLNLEGTSLHAFNNKHIESFNDPKGERALTLDDYNMLTNILNHAAPIINHEPIITTKNESMQENVADSYERLDVFFVHSTSMDPQSPTYGHTSTPFLSSIFPHTPPNSHLSLLKSNDILLSHFFSSQMALL
ncbi:hypothetical protein DEU56DRAFT_905970 [Suillus clintonianus]|uniref:uncharacterized protein n=1 Tax=Suillus clintonianus TaxID=1904413 RepID=UPI001B872E90|nr:uncharacterized protein DEU56DRAFT_905970 [Suillus clintonianus]KAG2157311.1 hypothetical protein DEU56DRAFT_905970 [Suillus clintonianus]